MKFDISCRDDIKLIISKFYEKLITDKKTLPFFKEIIAQNHLEKHLEIITDFWEDILLHSHNYKNNPMQKHLDFAKKLEFSKDHFTVWLKHFNDTINEHFHGEIAHSMKNRAQSIAMVMQIKMGLYKK